MKIFYAGCHYDHYDPKRGESFEYQNFYLSLKNYPGAEVREFPFERILELEGGGAGGGKSGRKKFNDEILEAVRYEKPDILFVFMYSDEMDPATLAELRKHTKTLAWFADDTWRFFNYSKFWAKHFSYAVTTYSSMVPRYHRAGQPKVLVSQWAADTKQYRPTAPRSSGPDVSFVGGWSNPRADIISGLAARGIKVDAYGGGWSGGRISQDDMLRIFSSSKINLALNPAPGFWNVNSLGRLVARPSVNRVVPDFRLFANSEAWMHRGVPQVKARHFEIPACGGFMMTGPADGLEQWYTPDKEIAVYANSDDLAQKIKYYLANDTERDAMASAAYERTIREHTYAKRFEKIFAEIGIRGKQ